MAAKKLLLIAGLVLNVALCLKFDDAAASEQPQQQPQQQQNFTNEGVQIEGRQSARHLFDFIGLGTGNNIDPFLRKMNEKCLNGELAECFKSQALNSVDEIFYRDAYSLTPHVRVLRVPETQLRSLEYEPYEFTYESREISESSDWNDLIQFGLRKIERFVKSHVIELQIPEELTDGGRYNVEARFIDEISDELDVIEDKKAPLLFKHKIKKMFIPMLIILKLFKLKLLLFLPFILGLTGLKKILSIGAFVIPGIIGYLKLCRPTSGFGHNLYSSQQGHIPQYSSAGVGAASYNPLYSKYPSNPPSNPYYRESSFSPSQSTFYRDATDVNGASNGIRFGDDSQDIAYRNSKPSS